MYVTCLLHLRNVSVATKHLQRSSLNTLIKTIEFTQIQHPNTRRAFITISPRRFGRSIRPSSGRGYKHIKENCAIEEASPSQST